MSAKRMKFIAAHLNGDPQKKPS